MEQMVEDIHQTFDHNQEPKSCFILPTHVTFSRTSIQTKLKPRNFDITARAYNARDQWKTGEQ